MPSVSEETGTCLHSVFEQVSSQDRCQWIIDNCANTFSIFDFSRFAYCSLDDKQWFIIPSYVTSSLTAGIGPHFDRQTR